MKTFRLFTAIAALSVAGVAMAMPPGSKPPKVSVQAPKGGARAPKVSTTAKVKGSSSLSTKSAKATTTAPKGKSTTDSSKTSSATTTSTSTTTTTTDTTTPEPPNAISTKIAGNPAQLARVEGMLPQGMTLEQATKGFRNQGQFLAALNASKNQGINFADLQQAMTVDGMSLGQATQAVKNAPAPAPDAGTGSGAGTGTTTGTTSTGTRPPGDSL